MSSRKLHKKYVVTRVDGREDVDAEYFVLRLDAGAKEPGRSASLDALMTYAHAIEEYDPDFARAIREAYLYD